MKEALILWNRALEDIGAAEVLLEKSFFNSAANRAYYAAFHAVSALFTLQGKSFSKHSGVEAAVHRDLVNTGTWSEELGASYSSLMDTRHTGDYGGYDQVEVEEATDALAAAKRILEAVRVINPEVFAFSPVDKEIV